MVTTRRGSIVVPALLGAAACAATVSWLFVTHLGAPPSQRLVDLDVYRLAGRAVLHGRDLYAVRAHPPQLLPFTYPPFAALLAVPLTAVPFMVAGWLWSVGEVVTTAVLVWLGLRPLWPRFGRWWPLALGVATGAATQMLPFRDEIKFGQVDELMVLLCLVDCLLLVRGRAGGVLVGVATAVKLTPGVFIVYLLVRGRRRAAGVAAATFVLASLLAAGVLPGDSRRFWTDALWHSERLRANNGTSNQSLRGMWLRAVHTPGAVTALWLLSAAVVAVIGFARAARAARDRPGGELTGVAITGLLAVLLSPVAWIHHLVWVVLVLGVLIGSGRSPRRLVAAAGVYAFYVVKVPWIGAHWLHSGGPAALARIVEDGYGLVAVVLLLTLRAQSDDTSGVSLAHSVTLRHNEDTSVQGGAR